MAACNVKAHAIQLPLQYYIARLGVTRAAAIMQII